MLLDLVQRLERLRGGRIGVHLHLSLLSRAYGRDSYLRFAGEAFMGYVSGMEGQIFPLGNGDIFFLAKDATMESIEAAVGRLQQLFIKDPLLQSMDERGHTQMETWYVLTDDYDALLAKARELFVEAEEQREKARLSAAPPEKPKATISPDLLARLEGAIERADLTLLTRRQAVCTIIDDAPPQPIFEEIFVSIEELQRAVAPDVDMVGNVWLFRYLTKTLDRRTTQMLIRDGVGASRPFSLNLNVETILSPDFAKFEAIVTPQLRGRLVIEMNKLDVFADLGAFFFARDYLRERGFRLCLDGLTHHTLRYYNRADLGFDLIKLYWSPGAVEDILPSMIPEVRGMVMETGQAHTILCRCDNARAVQTGQDLGIVMFQGYHVDRLLALPPPPPRRLRV